MKAKRFLFFILIMFFSLSLSAESAQFSVRGYLSTTTENDDSTYSQIEINDINHNSAALDFTNTPSIELDLDKVVSSYDVFSWKFYGNCTTNMTLNFKFSPLSCGTDNNISFTYTMTATGKATYTRLKSGYVLTLPESSQEDSPTGTGTTATVSDTDTTASFLYTPKYTKTDVQWNRTGTCNIQINSSDLEAAAAGNYVSTVTITVTTDGGTT